MNFSFELCRNFECFEPGRCPVEKRVDKVFELRDWRRVERDNSRRKAEREATTVKSNERKREGGRWGLCLR